MSDLTPEEIQAALALARSKRSSQEPDIIKPKEILRDIKSIPCPTPEGGYCQRCHAPIKVYQDGNPLPCGICMARAMDDEGYAKECARRIGGWKAWNKYTREAFIRTKFNDSAYQKALSFDFKKDSILFWGPKGTGKSHLSAIIKRPLIRAGLDVETVSVVELLAEAKSKIKEGQVLQNMVLRCINAKVLSLEDMAVEKPSEYVIEFYYRIIDGRYKDDRNGMIVTMNHSLDALDTYWGRFDPLNRISSRLKEMCHIESLQGEKDWRAERQL